MSWSKTIKGSFQEVRDQLHGVAAAVQADDTKHGASEQDREAHHLQARIATTAALGLTAGIPFQSPNPDTHHDRELELTLYGSSSTDGGNVCVGYKFGELVAKPVVAKK
jgi:hypothetical protein